MWSILLHSNCNAWRTAHECSDQHQSRYASLNLLHKSSILTLIGSIVGGTALFVNGEVATHCDCIDGLLVSASDVLEPLNAVDCDGTV